MERAIRKNVRIVSITSAADWNSSSSSSWNHSRMFRFMLYSVRSMYITAIVFKSLGDQPSSSSFLSKSSLLARYAFSGSRRNASLSSVSFCSWYRFMSKVCDSSIPWQPFTTGESTALIVPMTKVGKKRMHSPMANVDGFGTGERLPHLGGYVEQRTQPGNSLGYTRQLLAERHHVLIQYLQYLVQVREVYR